MALTPGTRLGPYEVLALIGVGGMGEVYKATDTNLKRAVAIKVLPALVAGDAERLARFQREAEVLAALNHPNIAQIHGLEKSDGTIALVMELVEGPTLADRIAQGAIPIDEALPVAKQIAEALEAAHEQGIIHRDLKPANIKVRSDGTVKVLDFGLAKAMDPVAGSSPSMSMSPTITTPAMTQAGMILGTAAYMAPEQARGKTVDRRADIWAFGVVLFEMLTGTRAFGGDDISDTLANVLKVELDWHRLPADVSPRVRLALRACLQKDPKQRIGDVQSVRLALDGAFETAAPPTPSSAASPASSGRLMWMTALAVAAVVIIALGIPAVRHLRETPPPEARPLRVSLVHTEGSEVAAPAISPDGRRVAYRARRADGMPLLWVRDLASGESRPLPGTEDAAMPFWSPDSRDLGFYTGVALKRVSAAGGPVRVVVDYVGMFGGAGAAWGADGTIVFSGGLYQLSRVPADGGSAAGLTKLPSQDWAHFWPSFLPDGRRFLFTAKLWTRTAEASEQGIYLGSLDSPTIERLLPDLSSAVYAPPGFIVFVREGTLTAAPFDLATGRVTGPPATIGGTVATQAQFYFAAISASADGTLAVRPPPAVAPINVLMSTSQTELRLVDRGGTGSRIGTARLFVNMALNPVDSRTLAAEILDPRAGTQDLWLMDLTKDTTVPLTTTRGFAGYPVWSADGKRVAYAYQPPGQLDDVYIKDIGTGAIQPVIETPMILEHPIAWSHDEKSLLVFTADDKGTYLSSWSFASRTLTRLVGPRTLENRAAFSPHDDLVAFTSQESGRPEVYVTTFPDHRQTWPITTEGGQVLSWRNDGREILVATLAGHIAAYPVSIDGGFSHGQPATLVRDIGSLAAYSTTTRDHARILIRVNPDAAKDKGEMQLLFGWQDVLRQGEH